MATIMHISDLHFGPPLVPPVAEALRRAARRLQPDLIVASGDFTQESRPEQFEAAREFLESLPDVPVVVTPGNHDVPPLPSLSMFFSSSPFRLYRQHIHDDLNYTLRHGDVAVVSLNSASRFGSLVEGSLGEGQLDFCTRAFRDVPDDNLKVVVAHHHLAPAPNLSGGGVMWNARRAIERFTDLKVDLILGGHKHRSYVGNSLDFYAGKSRDHGIIIAHCGTSTSRRGRAREKEKNSFNVIRTEGELIHITQRMYFTEAGGFEAFAEHTYPRADAKYVRQGVQIQTLEE